MLKKVLLSIMVVYFGYDAAIAMPHRNYRFKDTYQEQGPSQTVTSRGKPYIDALGKKPGCRIARHECLLFPIERDHLRVLAVALAMLVLLLLGMVLFRRWANCSLLALALSTGCCFYLTQNAYAAWCGYKAHKNLGNQPLIKMNSRYIEVYDYNVTPVKPKRFAWEDIPHIEHRWVYHMFNGGVIT